MSPVAGNRIDSKPRENDQHDCDSSRILGNTQHLVLQLLESVYVIKKFGGNSDFKETLSEYFKNVTVLTWHFLAFSL